MELVIEAVAEAAPGNEFKRRFERLWPHYRRWYVADGQPERPTFLACERALTRHLPQLLPTWQRVVELVGGGDLEARFLSLYCPPPYITACSQAAWIGEQPYCCATTTTVPRCTRACSGAPAWNGRGVIAMSDCLLGALDGVNDAGLAVSLSFGGSTEVGEGFGAPLLVRYLLEFCATTREASAVLRQCRCTWPTTSSSSIAMRDYVTAFAYPGERTILGTSRPPPITRTDGLAAPRRRDRHAGARAPLAGPPQSPAHDGGRADRGAAAPAPLSDPATITATERSTRRSTGPALGTVSLHWPASAPWTQSMSGFAAGSRRVVLAG